MDSKLIEEIIEMISVYNEGLQYQYDLTEYDILDLIIKCIPYVNDLILKKKIDRVLYVYESMNQYEEDITEYDLINILDEIFNYKIL